MAVVVLVSGIGGIAGVAAASTPLDFSVAVLTALIFAPFVLRALRSHEMDLEPLWPFLICYGITFALKPELDRAGFVTYTWFRFDQWPAVRAVVVATAALIVIYLSYGSGVYRAIRGVLPGIPRNPCQARMRAAGLVLAAGGAIALIVAIQVTGVSPTIRGAISGAYRLQMVGANYSHGYLFVLYTLATFAPGIQLFAALESRRAIDWTLFVAIAVGVLLVLTVVYSRQLFLQTFVMLFVIAHFQTRWFGVKSVVAAGVIALVAGGFLGLRTRDQKPTVLGSIAFLGHTFDSFEFVVAALDRFPPLGRLGGLSFAEDVTLTFLPRRVFPEKPDVFGIVRIQHLVAPDLDDYHVSRATFPPGFLVEGYANFGWVGLLIMTFAYGTGLRLAREWFWPRRDRLFPLLVYGGMILNMTSLFRSAAQFFLQMVVYSALLYVVLHGRVPVARQEAPSESRLARA